MSTNRPFFGSFLSAFRAHSAIQKAATSPPTAAASPTSYSQNGSPATSSSNSSQTGPSAARTITTKSAQASSAGATTVAIQTAAGQFQPTRQHSASPYSRSPGTSPSSGSALIPLQSRGRRGSDSSSEGFKESMGAEKWYIGGRTAAGEERIYKLSMVKRPRSIDRLSLDRMSL